MEGKFTAWCACMAGTSVRNHTIAVFYKVEHANVMGYNDPACTDMPCRWNHSKLAHVTGCRFEDVLIKKSVRTKVPASGSGEVERQRSLLKFDPRHEHHRNVTDQQVEYLLNNLYVIDRNSVIFTSVDGVAQKVPQARYSLT